MAGQTPIYGLPYQTLTDPPHGPDLGQDLAEAVEAELARIDAAVMPRGHVGSVRRQATVSTTSVEVLADAVTFNAVAGKRYKVTWDSLYNSSAASDNGEIRLRFAAGASVSNTGTKHKSKLIQPKLVNANEEICWVSTLAPNVLPAGQVTVGVFMVRTAGSGTHISMAAAGEWQTDMLVEDIGT